MRRVPVPDDNAPADRRSVERHAVDRHAADRHAADDRSTDPDLLAFVRELGHALSLAGTAVGETRERLARVATAYGVRRPRVVVLPTALVISFGRSGPTTVDTVPQLDGNLRLDQIAALYELVRRAERGAVDPAEGLRRVRAVRRMRPRFDRGVTVLGHVILTVGLCLMLRPTPRDLAVAAGLGLTVGLLIALARAHHTARILIPVLAAALVSALTFAAVGHGIVEPGLRTLIAPLVTFLPGAALTTATVELACGDMVAGASRLVAGAVQLLLLAFGIVAGADAVGLPRDEVLNDVYANALGWWAPWLGVLVFGVAVCTYFSAPRGALRWLLLVLAVAWVGQLAGAHLAGAAASGFLGAAAMTPVALAVSRRPGGPPSQVIFLPAFWLLVPGAVGLIRVTERVGNPAAAGAADLVQPLASIVAIALGVLFGTAVDRAVTQALSHRRRA